MKITTFTDESGQDTGGKFFIVCTVVVEVDCLEKLRALLKCIENESGKRRKWSKSGKKQQESYIKLLLKQNILSKVSAYYSVYPHTQKYVELTGCHIAYAVTDAQSIFGSRVDIKVDTLDEASIYTIKKILRSYSVRYYKVRGIPEEKDEFIRLADTLCGVVRDIELMEKANQYKYKRLTGLLKRV